MCATSTTNDQHIKWRHRLPCLLILSPHFPQKKTRLLIFPPSQKRITIGDINKNNSASDDVRRPSFASFGRFDGIMEDESFICWFPTAGRDPLSISLRFTFFLQSIWLNCPVFLCFPLLLKWGFLSLGFYGAKDFKMTCLNYCTSRWLNQILKKKKRTNLHLKSMT